MSARRTRAPRQEKRPLATARMPSLPDTIYDFASGDRIDLRPIATGAGDGHFHFLEGATQFSGQAGDLIVRQGGA